MLQAAAKGNEISFPLLSPAMIQHAPTLPYHLDIFNFAFGLQGTYKTKARLQPCSIQSVSGGVSQGSAAFFMHDRV